MATDNGNNSRAIDIVGTVQLTAYGEMMLDRMIRREYDRAEWIAKNVWIDLAVELQREDLAEELERERVVTLGNEQ